MNPKNQEILERIALSANVHHKDLEDHLNRNNGSVLKPSCKSILLSTQFHKYLLPLHHEESPIITLHLSRCTCRLL